MVDAIPKDYPRISPYLMVEDPAECLKFIETLFDAKRLETIEGPGGTIMHAETRIGDSVIMMGATREGVPAFPAMLYIYVEDVDAMYQKAIDLGATGVNEPATQFYGDRSCALSDKFGNHWCLATRIEELTSAELKKRVDEMMGG
ncbi:MAG: VOC family protein [Planctomycetota bacterium]